MNHNRSDYDCHIPDLAEENWESVETREPSPSIITRGFKDHYVERGGTWMRIVFSSATTCFPCVAIGEKYIGTQYYETELPDPKLPDKPIKVIVGPGQPGEYSKTRVLHLRAGKEPLHLNHGP